MCQLAGAGGAPRLYAVGIDRPIIVMEHIKGMTLNKFCQHGPKESLNKSVVRGVVVSAARNLLDVHHAGFYHNDLHSGNIMVCDNLDGPPTTRLIDFGWATRVTDDEEGVFRECLCTF